jgi:hypothetical protein
MGLGTGGTRAAELSRRLDAREGRPAVDVMDGHVRGDALLAEPHGEPAALVGCQRCQARRATIGTGRGALAVHDLSIRERTGVYDRVPFEIDSPDGPLTASDDALGREAGRRRVLVLLLEGDVPATGRSRSAQHIPPRADARNAAEDNRAGDVLYEPKWDGFRAIVFRRTLRSASDPT